MIHEFWQMATVFATLVVLEVILSIDNCAVLSVMVSKLPQEQQSKALRYGMIGAYIMRGLSLFFISHLMNIHILKVIGGAYLVHLGISHFTSSNDSIEEVPQDGSDSKISTFVRKYLKLTPFWSTVVLVEIMDMVFAIDNIFASVALSSNIWVIITGVFVGIAGMRYMAGLFVKLLAKYPELESCAYIVITLLGLKLTAFGAADTLIQYNYLTQSMTWFRDTFHNHTFDLSFSACMMFIFFFPILKKYITK